MGVWNSGNQRYEHVDSSIGGVGCNIRVTLPIDVLVTEVKVGIGASRPSVFGGGDKNAGVWLGTPNDGGTYIGGYSWPGGTWPDTQHVISISDVAGILATPEPHVWIHNSIQTGSGTAYVYWVHIETIPYVP